MASPKRVPRRKSLGRSGGHGRTRVHGTSGGAIAALDLRQLPASLPPHRVLTGEALIAERAQARADRDYARAGASRTAASSERAATLHPSLQLASPLRV